MTKPLYNITQSRLYTIAGAGWRSYLHYLSDFQAFRGYYNEAFGHAALAHIEAVAALPDYNVRKAVTKVYRIELVALANNCLARWQNLKRYITTSFLPEMQNIKYNEAGAKHYRRARNHKWTELSQLNVSATNFISKYQAQLLAGNNMPATFAAAYLADIAAYAAKLEQFIQNEQSSFIETTEKISANNAVYTALINMFKDGQEIFKNDDAIRFQFTFDSVLSLISHHRQPQPDTPTDQPIIPEPQSSIAP